MLNQKIAIMHGREYFSNIVQVVLKDPCQETAMFLSTYKKRLKLSKNTSNCIIIYFKMVSSQWILLFRCSLHTLFFICPICITRCCSLFLFFSLILGTNLLAQISCMITSSRINSKLCPSPCFKYCPFRISR